MTEFAGANQVVLSRTERDEGERRLSLRSGAEYTEASLIRVGETLDADTVCFGSFTISLPKAEAELKRAGDNEISRALLSSLAYRQPSLLSRLASLADARAVMAIRFDDIGQRLKAFRLRSGLSAEEIARARVGRPTVVQQWNPSGRTTAAAEAAAIAV